MQPKFMILLVDDDPQLADILHRASRVTFPEASFTQVHSHTEAISYINGLDTYGPRLVLLDIDLGESHTGFDFVTFLRAHQQARFLPIVMLTVDELPSAINSAYLVGASSFTLKPSSYEDWKAYMSILRLYWYSTVTMPLIQFHKAE